GAVGDGRASLVPPSRPTVIAGCRGVPGNDDIIRQAIVESPLARLLAVEVVAIERDRVRVRLPFRSEVTTVGDLVHGGAISALVGVAATAAGWTRACLTREPRAAPPSSSA